MNSGAMYVGIPIVPGRQPYTNDVLYLPNKQLGYLTMFPETPQVFWLGHLTI